MKTWLAIAVVALSISSSVAARQDAVPTELVPLQGTWVVTQINGDAAPGDTALKVVGAKYSELIDSDIDETGLVKLDASKTPMTIDLQIQTGDSAGKTQLGIVEIKGNTMRVLLNNAGDTARPTSFDKGDGELFIVAEKRG